MNNSDHYLLCNYRFCDNTIEHIKADVKRFMADKEKSDDYYKFIHWQKKDNELVVLTMYAYDDIQLPKKFDTVFQVDKPDQFIHLDFTLTQAVIDGWTSLNQISSGHKHICIIEFYNDIPNIFNSVPLFDEKSASQNGIQLGFCDKANLTNIQAYLQQKESEKGEHRTGSSPQ